MKRIGISQVEEFGLGDISFNDCDYVDVDMFEVDYLHFDKVVLFREKRIELKTEKDGIEYRIYNDKPVSPKMRRMS